MWGAKPGLNLDFAKILMKRLIQGSIEMRESHGKGLDQLLLGRYMFPFLDGMYLSEPSLSMQSFFLSLKSPYCIFLIFLF